MTDAVSESNIHQRLTQVIHPEIRDRNLVELGMIPKVQLAGNRVEVTLALPNLNVTIKGDLVTLIVQAVQLDGGRSRCRSECHGDEPRSKEEFPRSRQSRPCLA